MDSAKGVLLWGLGVGWSDGGGGGEGLGWQREEDGDGMMTALEKKGRLGLVIRFRFTISD